MTTGGAQQRGQMPSLWAGFRSPGEEVMQEKTAVYGFFLLAIIAKN